MPANPAGGAPPAARFAPSRLFDDGAGRTRERLVALYVLLIAGNLAAWGWALGQFYDRPVLLGAAFLAYSFGLRHAFDADHIAAIDNVTRKLMAEEKRPIAVGLFFSLGHSTIVVGLVAAIVLAATPLQSRFDLLRTLGGAAGTALSAAFLFAIAAANTIVLVHVYRAFRAVRNGGAVAPEDIETLLAQRGFLARLLRPAFALIRRSWHMYPLGVLFGLGFDTATEVGLLGIAATQTLHGLPLWSILAFPALFTAGMTLVDTTDSVIMVGAYGWAFLKPIRRLYYNLTITFVSVAAALVVGGIEALGLVAERFGLAGPFWDFVGGLGGNLDSLGYGIVAFFVACWVISIVVYRAKGYDRNEASV
jgi:nickel/cobalt transporter (NiCoT) family protein